jgi:two-component system, repressor protein LuxO
MHLSPLRPARTRPTLLLIERESSAVRRLADGLPRALGVALGVQAAAHGRAAVEALRVDGFDLVIADLSSLAELAPTIEEAIGKLARLAGEALVIALTDGNSVSAAMSAMRAGAHDVFDRSVAVEALASRINELALRHGKAFGPAGQESGAKEHLDFLYVMGEASPMRIIQDQIARTALANAPVFVTGEAGTGKTACGEALHGRSTQAGLPFAVLDCAALRENAEADLFGGTETRGALQDAAGGTLMLKEIGELALPLQERLLAELDALARAGTDVRLICATRSPPMQLVGRRKLREDLFYRLHGAPIHIPPLRQRAGDIAPLARHFLARFCTQEHKRFSGFSAEAIGALQMRDWPGNVRQLHTLVRRIVVMFDGGEIGLDMIEVADFEGRKAMPAERSDGDRILPMWQQEQRIIEQAIESFSGNIALAAAALEISPSTIYRKRQSWMGMSGTA